MKRIYFPISICLTLFMLSGLLLPAQLLSWQYENILSDLQQSGASPDLHLDAAGDLHVSFWLRPEEKLVYGHRDKASGQWTYELIPDAGAYGLRSAITTDPSGAVHIAFLHRQGQEAWLHYATNAGGSWTSSRIYNDSDLGAYSEGTQFPFYLEHSLDITMQANGEPVIMFFNGRVENTITCTSVPGLTSYNLYELNLNVTARQTGGGWNQNQLPDVSFTESFGCLPGVDRYGEFSQIYRRSDDTYFGIGNAMHSGRLMWARSAPGNLLNWNYFTIDSLERIFAANLTSTTFYEGFDDIVFDESPDGQIHAIYIVSNFYGKLSNADSRKRFYYTRFHPDSLGQPGYSPFYNEITSRDGYKNHFALAAKSADSVFISYHQANNSEVIVSTTTDGGQSWNPSTLFFAPVTSKMKMEIYQDSVFLLAYHEDLDFLSLSRRSVNASTWITENATVTEERGTHFSSELERVNNDDRAYIAFDEAFGSSVNYGERINGSWNFETVSDAPTEIQGVAMARYSNGDPVVVYVDEGSNTLVAASRNASNWQMATIQSGDQYRDLTLIEENDVLHLSYYVVSQGELRYATLPSPSAVWSVQLVDNSSLIVGQHASMAMDASGALHIAYVDVIGAKLKKASLTPGGSWTFSDVTNSQAFIPAFPDIKVRQDNGLVIAFRDASTNRIIIATEDGAGSWSIEPIAGDLTNLVGAPLKLVLDDLDRPWVLYNYLTASDELRLVRQDGNGDWNQVSVLNNINQIANSFDFHLLEDDFYILGKQNRTGGNGIGQLFAANGVNTNLEALLQNGTFQLAPNPIGIGAESVEISFDLMRAQEVSFSLYNLQGQKVHTIVEARQFSAGPHRLLSKTLDLSPGMYFVVLESAGGRLTQKLVVQP
ncbi:MAG: T9SS type A sorting domain-containing protein [Bacteroidota bacterium]